VSQIARTALGLFLAGWVPRIERAGGVLLLIAALNFLYQSAAATGLVPPLEFLLAEVS
jgi:cytochrome c-type biogenesis protein